MSRLLSRWQPPSAEGRTQSVTPERAGWGYVGFEAYELQEGQTLTLPAVSEERCLVLVAGRASISTPTAQFTDIGERMSPFERIKPWAVYVTPQETVQIKALTTLELAVCAAPGKGTFPTRLIAPQDIDAQARGKGHNQRYVHNILPEDQPADSLLVVEVWTHEGCTSSYPSHKHDTDNPPQETYLEETYYHRLNPGQGFCMQRVYTDDRSLDECMAVYNRDVVMVPKGYHPVATLAGYDSYYLNVMAGPVRKWMFTWEDDHAWINRDYPR
ncbi:TPA: 5-deoxy-glucuronate isomerase [Enterobacter ludwigii]|jgi:5-deoxy-glucuronate isomerase|uniref:5-deoxy-glucuronate isomerase n=1 Tax=Enterobacter TaxID=547 RepID=UPI0005CFC603|nr:MULTISPECIES: 5-deoxy-glucuronate isomerase [Enterobacter]EKS7211293.1 5-deoxy-glucuronate isomerase [Enterobacter ludwigii]KAA0521843.1 5-deoxy-glucuronate isomerase [Enterobacter ludwigii]KLP37713.1 5-deoxyglucuronate isomerase [Enterobacter ludwigii]KYO10147.1 5-deoxy-glucuronate isomerase [Enterobacter ludwigii]KZP48775.1 5-deoxy-glucuronate isomerase [Enterobacter ludwigii]